MGGPVAAVSCSQADRDEGFDGLADQLGVLVAEHFLEPPVDVRDVASVVAKGDRVGEDVGQLRQHGRGDEHGSGRFGGPAACGAAGDAGVPAAIAASREG